MEAYMESCEDGRRQYGAKFDSSDMDACKSLLSFFRGPRVKIARTYDDGGEFVRTGTISRTTGWKPALLLMSRSNAHGSSDVLDARDRIVAVQVNGKYRQTLNA